MVGDVRSYLTEILVDAGAARRAACLMTDRENIAMKPHYCVKLYERGEGVVVVEYLENQRLTGKVRSEKAPAGQSHVKAKLNSSYLQLALQAGDCNSRS